MCNAISWGRRALGRGGPIGHKREPPRPLLKKRAVRHEVSGNLWRRPRRRPRRPDERGAAQVRIVLFALIFIIYFCPAAGGRPAAAAAAAGRKSFQKRRPLLAPPSFRRSLSPHERPSGGAQNALPPATSFPSSRPQAWQCRRRGRKTGAGGAVRGEMRGRSGRAAGSGQPCGRCAPVVPGSGDEEALF